jgi:nucleotide-binding universal stress UspA family protein
LAQLFFKPKSILVPVKGQRVDLDAFRLGCSLARDAKSKLYAIYVIEVKRELPVDAEVTGEVLKGEDILSEIEALSSEEKSAVSAEILQAREAGPAVIHEAVERGIDLIIMGLPAKTTNSTFHLGDNVSYILKNATCPVLLWREPKTSGDEQE